MGNILRILKKTNTKNQKNAKGKIQKLFVFVMFLLFLATPVSASAPLQQRLNNINRQIDQAQRKLSDLRDDKRNLQASITTLSNEITGYENQIALTNQKISLLDQKIIQTRAEIANTERDLERTNNQLSELITTLYKETQLSQLEILIKSDSLSEFVSRSEYLEQMQLQTKETADRVAELKSHLKQRQSALNESKAETEQTRALQANQRNEVALKRSAKNNLLAVTQGNEARYRSLLANLRSEQLRVQRQLWAGGGFVSHGRVRAGDIIGRIGNSGFSTGCHLHFEIRNRNRNHVNPAPLIGNGFFIHPAPGVRVSAPYGFSSAYFAGVFHTGIDYADNCAGTPVRAAADGEIIKRVSGRPNTFPWSFEYGNYVIIRHPNGMFTLYAHLR